MQTVLALFAIQGLIGALDNLWHHQITEKLPSRPSARNELALHTVREFLYAVIFIGIAWASWEGLWAFALVAIMAIEIVVTLWDFVVEDQTRQLPKFERVLHTILAINFGVILAVFAPVLVEWAGRDTGFAFSYHGLLSWIMTVYGVGVFGWALYDLWVVVRLSVPEWQRRPIRSGTSPQPKTVLLTGATGFIGRSLTRALVERGDKPIVFARNSHKARYLFGPLVEVVESLESIPADQRIDAIINLAGEPLIGGLWTKRRKRKLVESRVNVTHAVVKLIERSTARPGVLVSGSAVGFYGIRDDEDLTENDRPQQIFMSELCQEWEAAAQTAEELGVRVCRLRIGLVFGADGGAFPQMALPARVGLATVFGTGKQWISWIHKSDLVRLILFAMDRPHVGGALNAAAPKPVTNEVFTRALGRHLRRPVALRAPAWAMRFLFGELADVFLAGQKATANRAIDLGFRFDCPTLDLALDNLLERRRSRAGQSEIWSVYFNDACPVCRTEIGHYRKRAEAGNLALTFHGLSRDDATLRPFGLSDEDARRRLYVVNARGKVAGGVDAFATIWANIPQYRWLSTLVRMPLIHGVAEVLYDGVAVPVLWARNCRRLRKQTCDVSGRMPLYRALLGPEYDDLPEIIQTMHDVEDRRYAMGWGRVSRGNGLISNAVANLLRMPNSANDISVGVMFERTGDTETLRRNYGGALLVTRQEAAKGHHRGMLLERFGPVALYIRLDGNTDGITFHLEGCALWVIPLPRALRPRLEARERETGGKYHYFVRVGMPVIGMLIEYEGFLTPKLERPSGE